MTTSFYSNSSLGIMSGGDPVELWEMNVRKIDDSVWTDPTKMILNVAHGECVDAKVIVNHMRSLGVSDEEILRRVYLIDNYTFFTNYAKRLGFKNVIHGDFLEMEFDVKFDLIIGNPPYGKNSSLAVDFINRANELSDDVYFVVPQTITGSKSTLSRIDDHIHFIKEDRLDPKTFDIGVTTSYIHMKKMDHPRPEVKRYGKKDLVGHMTFVKTAAEADMCVGRVGAGPGGHVYTEDYDHRSPSSHYFIQTKSNATRERLINIEPLLVERARVGNAGCPSLSLDDLAGIFFGE